MKIFYIITSIALSLALLSCTPKEEKVTKDLSKNESLIPLRDFFKNPEYAAFRVSPDGKKISFLKPWKKRMNIFVQNLSDDRLPVGEPKQVTFIKERDMAGYFWKENSILYLKDFSGDENFHLFGVDIETGREKDLTPFSNVRVDVVDDLKDVSDTDVLVQMNKKNPELFDVYRLNIKTGDLKLVAENPGKYVGWGTDHEGNIRVAVESDGLQTIIHTRNNEKSQFKEILKFDYKNNFSPLFFTFDNKELYASSNISRDKSAIVKVNPETGKEIETLFKHPEVDVYTLSYSQKRKLLTAATYTTWKDEYKFFDAVTEKIYNNIKKEVGDYQIYFTGHNKDEDLFTIAITNDTTKAKYFLYDYKKNRLTFLANVAPWLKPENLSPIKPVQYKSRDGFTIHGYLTLPNNSKGKNLPIVVHPHGGPWHRDIWGYDPEIQFLANRGFAVFQMNFRGSTGYGKEFFTKSFKEWGKSMQNDITDGVLWLIREGVANPKKVAIYGGSYGGYATLAGITFTPELYKCAVDYVGVSNLFTFLETIPPYWKTEIEKLYAMIGDPVKDKEQLTATSPAFHTDKIKAALFVAQGAKDPRVNINESNQIVESLKKRGIEVQYMVKENEGHGFHNEENRFEFYEAMESFLRDCLM